MKKQQNIFRSILKPALGLSLIALTAISCSKDDDVKIPGNSGLAVIHAAPGTPELTFKINGVKSNTKALTFGAFNGYGMLQEGNYEFSVTKKDSTRILTKAAILLKNAKVYSLFIADIPSKPTFTLVEDDLTSPASEKANLRFINMSPDAGSLDLAVTGQTAPLFTKTLFKGATAFSAITPGSELSFEIRENAKTEVLAKIGKVKIEKGKIYTIWAKGLKAATDTTKLSLAVITNK
jgi:hypothetical protein